jgi:hypothetical protein
MSGHAGVLGSASGGPIQLASSSPATPTLACDRHAERHGDLEFATVLANDLASRAIMNGAGACWPNHEYRATLSALSLRTGWAMGNTGIIRELPRFARVITETAPSYAVTWPDHPAAGHAPDT